MLDFDLNVPEFLEGVVMLGCASCMGMAWTLSRQVQIGTMGLVACKTKGAQIRLMTLYFLLISKILPNPIILLLR